MVKQERAARTREALIRAAAEAFGEEGFALASLSMISSNAKVSNGALYFHFSNKQALALAVCQEARAGVREIMEAAEAAVAADGALQALIDATHALMYRLACDNVVRAGFELSAGAAMEPGAGLREYWQRWTEDMLRRAERGGQLAEGVSSDKAASAITAATVGFEVLGQCDREWLSQRRIGHFWELLLPGLASGKTPVTAGATRKRSWPGE